jgi:hypothetical protein
MISEQAQSLPMIPYMKAGKHPCTGIYLQIKIGKRPEPNMEERSMMPGREVCEQDQSRNLRKKEKEEVGAYGRIGSGSNGSAAKEASRNQSRRRRCQKKMGVWPRQSLCLKSAEVERTKQDGLSI